MKIDVQSIRIRVTGQTCIFKPIRMGIFSTRKWEITLHIYIYYTILYIYIKYIYIYAWETNLKTMTFRELARKLLSFDVDPDSNSSQTRTEKKSSDISRSVAPPILDIGTWHTCLRLINLPIFPTAIPMMSLLFVACIMLNSFKFQFGSVWCVQILFGLIHVNSNFCHTQMNTHTETNCLNTHPKYLQLTSIDCNSFVIQIPSNSDFLWG